MTYSKLGIDGQLIEELDQHTGKKKLVFSPTIDPTGKEVPVYLYKASRPEGVYCLGLQGTGKSGLIENLCFEDGKQGTGFCVIDPHGELINHVLARLPAHREQDVILFDIRDYHYPFGLNLFTCSDPTNPLLVQEVVDQVMHVFRLLVSVTEDTPLILDWLRNCTYVLIANPGYTMADIRMLLTNKTCRERLLQNIPATPDTKEIVDFWRDYNSRPQQEQKKDSEFLLRRVRNFLQPLTFNIVGQGRTAINFREVMDEGKIVLVKLDSLRLGSVTKLIGALIIALFKNAAPSRTNGNLFNIYADEFPTYATEDFVTLIEQARKHSIGLFMAHQNRGQLDETPSNVASELRYRTLGTKQKIIFSIIGHDAEETIGEFYISPGVLDTREKPVRTPVMEPIQYMVKHGVPPLDNIRTFIEVYGRDLVELAKKEEDDERARIAEERRYEYNVEAGVRYYAEPFIQVTHHYRNLLKLLNTLFYEAMKAGKKYSEALKAGNRPENLEHILDDMLASRLLTLVDTFIDAFQQDKKGYRHALEAYRVFVSEQYRAVGSGVVESGETIDRLVTTVRAITGAYHDYDINRIKQNLQDGKIDTLTEEIYRTNRVWWQTVIAQGVEHSLFADAQVELLSAPHSQTDSDTAVALVSGVDNRKAALQAMLAKMPVVLAKKLAYLHRKETFAQQRLREALREYLLAEVRAVRANIVFVEKNWRFVVVQQQEEGTARLYFPEYFSKEEPTHQAYDPCRMVSIVFEDEKELSLEWFTQWGAKLLHNVGLSASVVDEEKPQTYEDIRKHWGGYDCYSFDTWKDAASFYFHLFDTDWFRIVAKTFFDKRNWHTTEREVYWKFHHKQQWVWRITEMGLVRRAKYEDNNKFWLQTWELKPGIEQTWVTPRLLEAEIERVLATDHAIYYEHPDILGHMLWYEMAAFHSTYNSFHDPAIKEKTDTLTYAWKETKGRLLMAEEKTFIETLQKQIKQEVALLADIETEKPIYDAFVAAFQEKMRQIIGELATPAGRVEDQSGQWIEEPVAQGRADRRLEMSNELANMPNYVARVKLLAANGKTFVEHTIHTLDPDEKLEKDPKKLKRPKLYGTLLDDRIERIKTQNTAAGYICPKRDVEVEIAQRQTGCSSGATPAQLQQSPPPQQAQAPHTRQVTTCPKCGKSNSRGSQYCKQCGTELNFDLNDF